MKSLIIGCGAWGTTLAALMAGKTDVYLYCHDPAITDEINNRRTNSRYLPTSHLLPANITAINEPHILKVLPDTEIVIIAVAARFFRKMLCLIKSELGNQTLVSATKGMDIESNQSILDICEQELTEDLLTKQMTFISGPNLAREIYMGKPAATTIASHNLERARQIQSLISSTVFRAYISDDIIGVEYGGVLKNIIAIAAGVSDALDLGFNSKSALLVRALAEMKRYAVRMGAKEDTLYGLSGLGDLLTTCMSPSSRNYSVGYRLGKGEHLEAVINSMNSIAEGVANTKVVYEKSRQLGISMPITEAVYAMLYEKKDIRSVIQTLMLRQLKTED